MEYRNLLITELTSALFAHFRRRQIVTDCWRKRDGQWVIIREPFTDEWSAEDYQRLLQRLREILKGGGLVYGAFAEGCLKGFTAVKAGAIGSRKNYLDLEYIHVSEDYRGQGVGRVLFTKARQWARERGAAKLYISAQSSVESQAFYKAMGCVEAAEYNPKHAKMEPFDCQLECEV